MWISAFWTTLYVIFWYAKQKMPECPTFIPGLDSIPSLRSVEWGLVIYLSLFVVSTLSSLQWSDTVGWVTCQASLLTFWRDLLYSFFNNCGKSQLNRNRASFLTLHISCKWMHCQAISYCFAQYLFIALGYPTTRKAAYLAVVNGPPHTCLLVKYSSIRECIYTMVKHPRI